MDSDSPATVVDRGTSTRCVREPGEAHAEEVALLRQIVDRLGEFGEPQLPPSELERQDVVLQVSICGARYLLVRCLGPDCAVHLSPREREIVRLVARGLPNKAIAALLDVSPWTVATHLRRVFAKYDVSSRAELVSRAMHEYRHLDEAD